jgi:hypothetical protein
VGSQGQGEKKARDFGGFNGEKGYHGTRNGSPTLCVWVVRERESLAPGFLGCFRWWSLKVCERTKKEKIQEEKKVKSKNNILII